MKKKKNIRFGFCNIYKDLDGCLDAIGIYKTEEAAVRCKGSDCIATGLIIWKE